MPEHISNRFSHRYQELCYSIWYTNTRPSMPVLLAKLEPDEFGRIPEISTLVSWRSTYAWDTRADTADIEVSKQTDRQLVNIRMKMMKRHAEIAQDVAERAYQHLKDVGFDSSTSAVNALFKSIDEEKKSRGMEVALSQVFSLNDDDLQKTMNRLLNRASGLGEGDDVIEGKEVDDATSAEETTE